MACALLFANGLYHPDDLALAHTLAYDLLIAVDGGYRAARRVGRPHLFVGDADSLPQALLQELRHLGVEVHRFPSDKDATDLELAVQLAVERGARTLHIFGGLGGRWDHSLANLLLVLHPGLAYIEMVFYHQGQRLFPVRKYARLQAQPGDTVSFLALTPEARGVTLRGFRYPLENGTLLAGSTLGVSNVVEQTPAEIWVEQGVVLAVHIPRKTYRRIESAKSSAGGMP